LYIFIVVVFQKQDFYAIANYQVEFPYRPPAMASTSNFWVHSALYKDGKSVTGAKIKTSGTQ
jgi:hypothetical protein